MVKDVKNLNNLKMMKKITFITIVCLTINSFAQTTFVPDDNFEQALIDLGYDSGPLDDYVPTANIASLTSLDVFNKNISDLTGIEDFIALTSLNCQGNNLSSIDISQNVALESLLADVNNLSTLDVTQNVNLVSLFCGANNLTTLDLSQNSLLQIVNCQSNNLTSIDLKYNPLLTRLLCQFNQLTVLMLNQHPDFYQLWCHNNQLTYLNIKNGNNTAITDSQFNATNNPGLTCIEVDDTVYSNATWTNVDATTSFNIDCGNAMTYVPDDNFEQKLINLGHDSGPLNDYVPTANIENLTFLNVFNSNISDLTGIQDFVSLVDFSCNINNLTTLDFSQNVNLVTLKCGNNDLVSLNVSQNPNLELLHCHGNNLTNLDVSQNPYLYQLYAHANQLAALNLASNDSLKILWCDNNQITDLDLSFNSVLEDFRCNDNSLNSLNVKNGNNSNMPDANFKAQNNPNLTCITVDSPSYSSTNWLNIDTGVDFNLDCNTIGIDENKFSDDSIFPNPTNGVVNIQFGEAQSAQIRVVNVNGKLIYQEKINNQSAHTFKIEAEAGVYFMEITKGNLRKVIKLVIK